MRSEPHGARTMVWALPRSLAATYGIILIFSSSGYLDVSVHRVPSVWLWIHHTVTGSASRVSPFRYPRISACLRLPVAFRSLSRLSSALSAKASTLRPFLLNLLCRSRGLVLLGLSHGDSCASPLPLHLLCSLTQRAADSARKSASAFSCGIFYMISHVLCYCHNFCGSFAAAKLPFLLSPCDGKNFYHDAAS